MASFKADTWPLIVFFPVKAVLISVIIAEEAGAALAAVVGPTVGVVASSALVFEVAFVAAVFEKVLVVDVEAAVVRFFVLLATLDDALPDTVVEPLLFTPAALAAAA
jgi:hypothetical protein